MGVNMANSKIENCNAFVQYLRSEHSDWATQIGTGDMAKALAIIWSRTE